MNQPAATTQDIRECILKYTPKVTTAGIRELEQGIERRRKILDFEELLKSHPDHWEGDNQEKAPLKHEFAPGIYLRTIHLAVGTLMVGKLHKHQHPTFLQSGKIQVATESGGSETLEGPQVIISNGLTKRAVVALTDVVWTSVHPNPSNTQDLEELEAEIIEPDLTTYRTECHLER